MIRWEYRAITRPAGKRADALLNELGAEGWEVVSAVPFTPIPFWVSRYSVVMLKRELSQSRR